jgi:hypothetical protein
MAARAEMFVEGALTYEEAAEGIEESLDRFEEVQPRLPAVTGTLVLRFDVSASGVTGQVRTLMNTLVVRPWDTEQGDPHAAQSKVLQAAVLAFEGQTYAIKDEESIITMPVEFG